MCPWFSAAAAASTDAPSDGHHHQLQQLHHHHQHPSAVLDLQEHLAQLQSDGGKYKQSVYGSCRYASVSASESNLVFQMEYDDSGSRKLYITVLFL